MTGLFVNGVDVSTAADVRVDDVQVKSVYADGAQIWTPPGALFDAVGAGSKTGAWSHTINGDELLVGAVTVNVNPGSTSNRASLSMQVGSTPIPQLSVIDFISVYSAGTGYITASLWLFGLQNPPQGAQTITPTVSGANHGWEANSVSYTNATGLGTATTGNNAGPGTLTVPCAIGSDGLGFAALAGWRGSTTTTTTTPTTVRSKQTVTTGISNVVVDLILTDAPPPATGFTANGAGGSNYTTLGGITVPIAG